MLAPLARRLCTRRPAGEEGFALLTTVLTLALLAAFSLVALQQTIDSTAASRKDQDWVAALAAAQAGVDDYVSRLNETNGGYHVHSAATPDTTNPAMLFTGGEPQWAPVVTATGAAARGSYHYDVDTSGYTGTSTVSPNGNIVVESTGKVGSRTRTIRSSVRRAGFVDYVYFTDFDTQDPLDYPVTATPPNLTRDQAATSCVDYWGVRDAACTDVQFANDSLSGPVHSNDTMLVCENALFKDVVTTMAGPVGTTGKAYRTDKCPGGTSGTSFARTGDPKTVKRVAMPATNLGLKAETGPAATPRGCLYVGPTRIVVKGAQIKVTSPWTRTVTPGCAKDTFFTIPVNGVVYVDVVPADGTTDVNSWGVSQVGRPSCPGPATTRSPLNQNNLEFPISGELGWTYPCKAGDVFIEQEGGLQANALTGRLTVSANNNLYVTNHLDYAGSDAFLGLIAEQFVYVWHPVGSTGNLNLPGQSTPFTDARISAAILSVNHAFMVQHYDLSAGLGTLRVNGAITQRFRGIVRRGNAGYAKDYVYDQRLRYDSPPRFLNPMVSSFSAARTEEREPKYR